MIKLPVKMNKENVFEYYSINRTIDNRSLRYIFPLLHEKKCYRILRNNLIACGIKYEKNVTAIPILYVVCKLQNDTDLQIISNDADFVSDYSVFTIFGFEIKDVNYYNNFVNGKYSKMKYFPQIICKETKYILQRNPNYISALIRKYPYIKKDGELDSIINMDYETIF